MSEETTEKQETTTEETVSALPSWAQKLITDLRAEAAGHRTRANDAEAQLTELGLKVDGLSTQVDEHKSSLAEKEKELESERFSRTRDRLASERGIPLDVAERLNASDEESLTAALDAISALKGTSSQPDEPTKAPGGYRVADPAQAAPATPTEADVKAQFANQIFGISN